MSAGVWVGALLALAVLGWLDVGRRRLVAARREAEAADRQLAALLHWRARAAARLLDPANPDGLSAALAARQAATAWTARAPLESQLGAALAARAVAVAADPDLADVCARLAAFLPVWHIRVDQLVAARAGARGRFLARTFAPAPPAVLRLTLSAEAPAP